MAKLWFQNRMGEERWIADCDTLNDVSYCINKFIEQANVSRPEDMQFKSYYMRMWVEDGRTKIDVGSWNEFFFWEKLISSINMKEDGEAEIHYDS